jgi:putative tryptophan/tyrosine transport system substrate-binding protein
VNRRALLTLLGGAAGSWPLAARAQQPERIRRIGVLMGLREDDLESKSRLAKLRQELERLGWSEGSNLHMDIRFSPAGDEGATLAKELVALRPEVMLAHTGQVAGALQGEMRVIPVVFVNVSDPVGAGFVSNLARPGGNLTPCSPAYHASLSSLARNVGRFFVSTRYFRRCSALRFT